MIVGAPEKGELREAFDTFSKVADRVHSAWANLSEHAKRLDQDIAEANATLRCQVGALESLSGSLAAVLRAIPSGVVVADTHGMIVMANPAAEEILGRKGRELIGKMAEDVVGANGAHLLNLILGPGHTAERVLETGDGMRLVDGCVVRATDTEGNEVGLVEVLNDRSEVKALREEVRRLDGLAELGRVAAIIAHEIRNPLSGIRGFAGMLERHHRAEHEGGPRHRWSKRICDGAERADAIIDSVLYLSRPRVGATEEMSSADLIQRALDAVAGAFPAKLRGVSVVTEVTPADLTIRCEAIRIEQALQNLIENALEAISGHGTLRVTAGQSAAGVTFQVEDDGPGVSDAARVRLFEPFFTTRTDGAGLGLALVARVAEVHGGSVACIKRDSGATFQLTLPNNTHTAEAIAG